MKLLRIRFKISASCQGFTLIEILVAISIMAVLTTIVFVSFTQIRKNTRDSQRMRDLGSIQQALEMYRSVKKSYPATLTDTDVSTYLSPVPVDPSGDSSKAYVYSRTSADKYVLCAYAETNKFSKPVECTTAICDYCTMGITSQ